MLEKSAFLIAAKTGLIPAETPAQESAESPLKAARPLPRRGALAELRQAALIWGAVQALANRPHPLPPEKKQKNDNMEAVREQLGDQAMEAAAADGGVFSLEQTIALALQKLT